MTLGRPLALFAAVCAALAAVTPARAHYPFCTCEKHGETIRCKGGFSDGTGAEGVKLDVIGYDESVLIPGKFGKDSVIEFTPPTADFYVLFDAGPGHVVEVDHNDIP
ncbi:hypothetical protein [Methylopila sp. M107]|uniref:hypothetical protein n=1 Tax=Methylopila sp. M107 TaxID=1101190 RepID=UPI0003782066|nr:hypothetical protein [Methylopila sp. M107]